MSFLVSVSFECVHVGARPVPVVWPGRLARSSGPVRLTRCSRFCDSVLPPPSQDSQHENDIVVKKWAGGVCVRCVSVRRGSRSLGDHPECACTDAAVTERTAHSYDATHMMRREGAWSIFTMRAGPRGPGVQAQALWHVRGMGIPAPADYVRSAGPATSPVSRNRCNPPRPGPRPGPGPNSRPSFQSAQSATRAG